MGRRGIEAEAGMLGQPVYFLTPEVVGVHLTGTLKEGVTVTDLVLRVTEMLLYKAQGLCGIPRKGDVDYTVELELDLDTIVPGVAGPKRPQDHINLPELKQTFEALLEKPLTEGGYGKNIGDLLLRIPVHINGSTPSVDTQMPSTDTDGNHPEEGLPKNEVELIQNRPRSPTRCSGSLMTHNTTARPAS